MMQYVNIPTVKAGAGRYANDTRHTAYTDLQTLANAMGDSMRDMRVNVEEELLRTRPVADIGHFKAWGRNAVYGTLLINGKWELHAQLKEPPMQ